MSKQGKIISAFAEWDDRAQTFRVYLDREPADEDTYQPEAHPMEVRVSGDSIEARLYRAAFVANAKDFTGDARDHLLGFAKKTQAERAVKAVSRELKRVEKGEPGPTLGDVHLVAQIATALRRRK